MNDDQFETLDTDRFRLIKRLKWPILLLTVVVIFAAFSVVDHLPPPWASGPFPHIPKYPGSSVIESHV